MKLSERSLDEMPQLIGDKLPPGDRELEEKELLQLIGEIHRISAAICRSRAGFCPRDQSPLKSPSMLERNELKGASAYTHGFD